MYLSNYFTKQNPFVYSFVQFKADLTAFLKWIFPQKLLSQNEHVSEKDKKSNDQRTKQDTNYNEVEDEDEEEE